MYLNERLVLVMLVLTLQYNGVTMTVYCASHHTTTLSYHVGTRYRKTYRIYYILTYLFISLLYNYFSVINNT